MANSLTTYLDYYNSLSKPGYAVLVTGEWGVGKTYQVLNHIKKKDRYYISLFGVGSVEQIDAEMVALCNPKLSKLSSSFGAVSNAATNLGGAFSFANIPSSAFNAVFKQNIRPDRVLIFDDFERSALSVKLLLGVVNQYVEHYGFQVIIIAHDEDLKESVRFYKEKVIGQTIEVTANCSDVYNTFCSNLVDGSSRDFISSFKDQVIELFSESGVVSLRVLRHVIEDLVRLRKCLRDEDLNNNDLMSNLIGLFVVFDIEVRKGNVLCVDVQNRSPYSPVTNNDESSEVSVISNLNKKYSSVDMHSTLLRNDTLVSVFFMGEFDSLSIQRDIDSSVYNPSTADKSPWQILSSFDDLDDEIIEVARINLNKQFSDRSVCDSGEMLHIFALKMFMVDSGVELGNVQSVKTACKCYIDDLKRKGELPPREKHERWYLSFHGSHNGIKYWVQSSYQVEFNEVLSYLIKSREEVLFNDAHRIWLELKHKMHHDSIGFLSSLSSNNHGVEGYQTIPILKMIDPDEFIDAWMQAPKENWRNITFALSFRYSHLKINRYLSEEREWARILYFNLNRLAEENDGFQALRIRRAMPNTLVKYFGDIEGVDDYKALNFEFIDE
ncbi:hypothetical protein E0X81_01750 [Halomonas sp. GDM18]|nr:hypothetical protein E0X81_01750 [Halomonas sp. GDM18]